MTTKTKKKAKSTFDRMMQDPERKKRYEEGYRQFLLSEVLVELMEEEHATVRELAAKAGISPTIIQEVRSGKRKNVSLTSVGTILHALGWELVAKKGRKQVVLA